MFYSQRTNNKIRIVYDDDFSTFDQLLAMDKFFCIHDQSIRRLLTEIWKALHDISGNSLKELLVERESAISLRSKPELVMPSVNSVLKGKNSLRYFGSVICNSICKIYISRIGYIKVSDY